MLRDHLLLMLRGPCPDEHVSAAQIQKGLRAVAAEIARLADLK
jgi:hypothetical protein